MPTVAQKTIYNLELHDDMYINVRSISLHITRVHGGWLYRMDNFTTFVPWPESLAKPMAKLAYELAGEVQTKLDKASMISFEDARTIFKNKNDKLT